VKSDEERPSLNSGVSGAGVILEHDSDGQTQDGGDDRPYSENICHHFLRPEIVFGKGVWIQLECVIAIRWSSRRIAIIAFMGQRRERVPMTNSRRLRNGSLHTLKSMCYVVVINLCSARG